AQEDVHPVERVAPDLDPAVFELEPAVDPEALLEPASAERVGALRQDDVAFGHDVVEVDAEVAVELRSQPAEPLDPVPAANGREADVDPERVGRQQLHRALDVAGLERA